MALAGAASALTVAVMVGWAIRVTFGDPSKADGSMWVGPEPLTAILYAVACVGLAYACFKAAQFFFIKWEKTGK